MAALFLESVVIQRLMELMIARRNTAQFLTHGAYEVGAAHSQIMVAIHSFWACCLPLFGDDQPVADGWLALFAILQGLHPWILRSLGARWKTRLIILPELLVMRGPFMYLKHPNDTLVVAEIIMAPMVLGLVWVAVLCTFSYAAMLWARIAVEGQALAPLRGQ